MIAKIEKVEAYEHLDEIIAVTDGVMVARGDYGVEAGVARVPLMQKDTIARATQAGKLVITATQMLESMIQSPEPTRAEAADVANAVIDGTLGGDALGRDERRRATRSRPCARWPRSREAAEEAPMIHGRAREIVQDTPGRGGHARRGRARRRGRRGRARRPDLDRRRAARVREVPPPAADHRARPPAAAWPTSSTLEWGVYPTTCRRPDSVDELIDSALEAARDFAGLEPGAHVVITAGRAGMVGGTNLIMVREIPAP